MLWPEAISLIRRCRSLALASNSAQMAGYPHVSWLPMIADEAGRPLLIMSRLAEHTQNVLNDSKVSVLLHDDEMGLSKARLTILGDLQPATVDALLESRLARYNPELASYLAMGDFAVWRLWPLRARYIAGFGRMGWVEGEMWDSAPSLTLAEEAELLAQFSEPMTGGRPDGEMVGIDLAGYDLRVADRLIRHDFPRICHNVAEVTQALQGLQNS
ncbi:HugZ family protein [Chitinibacter sp. S2-10]|uniref:HugZ family pyridoxamine 5'-phosphate oxidase n=1 Tax=Chitinibacter sp. S2-10 TaxID=3373597 RepID=UPI003977402A